MTRWVSWTLAAWFCLCGLLLASVSPAQAREPFLVLVLSDERSDGELVERLRGQTSDLDVRIEVAVGQALPVAAERAIELGARRGADVVVWFERPDSGADRLIVHIAERAGGAVLVRELGEAHRAPNLASSTQEAAALVIREALRAAMAGSEMPRNEAAAGSERVPALPSSPVASSPAKPRGPALAPYAAVGWNAAVDGEAARGHQGPAVNLGLQWSRLDASLFASIGLPVEVKTEYALLSLSRHAVGVRGLLRFELSRRFDLGFGLRGGLLLYYRRTSEPEPSVTATGARLLPSAIVGPEVEIGFFPAGAAWGLLLMGGLDVVSGAPEIGYTRGDTRVVAATPMTLQPHLELGLQFGRGRPRISTE